MPAPITCHCGTCLKCRTRERERHVSRMRAYGQWEPWADPQPVREHVRGLMAAGMSITRIANAVDVYPPRISKLLYGRQGVPLGKVRSEFSAAILALEPDPLLEPAYKARRRVAALIAIGYSQNWIARRLGFTQFRIWELLNRGDHTTKVTLERIDTLYRDHCMTPAPTATPRQAQSVARAKAAAKRNGWLPALCWDNIDDPDEKPSGGIRVAMKRRQPHEIDPAVIERMLSGELVRTSTNAEKLEVMRRWMAAGGSERALCLRFGWKPGRYAPRDEVVA